MQHPGRQQVLDDAVKQAARKIRICVNVHNERFQAPDIGGQTEGCTEPDGNFPTADQLAENFVHFHDMGKTTVRVKVRCFNLFQIIPGSDQGLCPVDVRHIGSAVFDLLPQGFGFNIIDVVIKDRYIDAVFFLNFKRAGSQNLRGRIKLSGRNAQLLHGELVHLSHHRDTVRNSLHGSFKPFYAVLKSRIILINIQHYSSQSRKISRCSRFPFFQRIIEGVNLLWFL